MSFINLLRYGTDLCTLLQIIDLLLPPDNFADCSAVNMELIAGAGGLEAAMFARDLYTMYEALAKEHNWRFTPEAEGSCSDKDPIHHSNILIESLSPNDFLFARLRWEAGVHRVQRIPTTSKLNKIHTSTVAVTILPSLENVSSV